jgi:thiosulfate/3-mercaptopyruvate sulfurtransferase
MDILVSTEWLAGELENEAGDLVVLDASAYLPTEKKDGATLFREAHVAGAQFFDLDLFSEPEARHSHTVPTESRFARLAGALGISNRSRVVAYDQKGLFSAARAWWLFGLFGHDRVAVLDGGLPKWVAEAKPVVADEETPRPQQTFTASLQTGWLAGTGDLMDSLAPGTVLLDARSSGRFTGSEPEPRPGMRSGHIPGSRNLPYSRLLAADGRMRPVEELRGLLAELGVGADSAVVTSCGSGMTAAIINLAMRRCGYAMPRLYDGSWSEWGSRADLPVAAGAD